MADAAPILQVIEPAQTPPSPTAPGAGLDGVFAALLAQRLPQAAGEGDGLPGEGLAAQTPLPVLPLDDIELPPDGNPLPLDATIAVDAAGVQADLSLAAATPVQPGVPSAAGPTTPLDALSTAQPDLPASAVAVGPGEAAAPIRPAAATPSMAPVPAAAADPASEPAPRPQALPAAVLRLAQAVVAGQSEGEPGRAPSLGAVASTATAAAAHTASLGAGPTTGLAENGHLSAPLQRQIEQLLGRRQTPSATGGVSAADTAPPPSAAVTAGAATGADNAATANAALLASSPAELRSLGQAAVPTLGLSQPLGHPGWSSEMGQRLVWLAQQDVREAKLQLNPRHLGPIDVRIVYGEGQQLSVSFSAHHPAAREALDAALPRLREMFEQQGLNLGDADVSQESFAQGQPAADHDGQRALHGETGSPPRDGRLDTAGEGLEAGPVDRPAPSVLGSGMLDAFA